MIVFDNYVYYISIYTVQLHVYDYQCSYNLLCYTEAISIQLYSSAIFMQGLMIIEQLNETSLRYLHGEEGLHKLCGNKDIFCSYIYM